ncbi:hypothetical protein ACHAW5_003717 [Stephanodiscus triporus]|uniref:JmjC domain-containing protein n=1 Tax=Stephanodiscus triporus TaxID=2934178 RepID=A0ABD3Q002_9STRA
MKTSTVARRPRRRHFVVVVAAVILLLAESASASAGKDMSGNEESYYGKIDDMPEDALRFFPPRRDDQNDDDDENEEDDEKRGLSNETLAEVVARLKAEMFKKKKDDYDEDEGDSDMKDGEEDDGVDYGNHNLSWEDGPSSWDEFGHDNDPAICRMRTMTVEEWEMGRHWRNNVPVMVTNVTEGWAANHNWKLEEMLKRYPDAEATMGDGRRVGEIGPDAAGRLLSPTTVKVREFITKHMYNPFKYFFDRKIAIPKGMLEDCRPFPLPTRKFLDDPLTGTKIAPSKKRRVQKDPRTSWRDHLAIAIGADLQGLTFHRHGAAWNTVIFGKKRWIIYKDDGEDPDLYRRMALESPEDSWREILPTPEWIRHLYPDPWRIDLVRKHGMDCIQHAGTMMFVPRGWMHMVVNIGDTVSVISEVGLDKGEGKKPEDFLYDPHASSDDSEDESEEGGGKGPVGRRGPPPGRGRRPPARGRPSPPSEDSGDDDSEDSEDEYDDSDDVEDNYDDSDDSEDEDGPPLPQLLKGQVKGRRVP